MYSNIIGVMGASTSLEGRSHDDIVPNSLFMVHSQVENLSRRSFVFGGLDCFNPIGKILKTHIGLVISGIDLTTG